MLRHESYLHRFVNTLRTSVTLASKLFACVALCAAVSRADDVTTQARKRFAEGLAAVDRGDFEAARVAFRQAYLLKQEPPIAHNLGLAELMSGHFLDAARHLDTYLRTARDAQSAMREKAKEELRSALKRIGQVEIQADPEAMKVDIDGETVDAREVAFVEPGPHTAHAEMFGRTITRTFAVDAGEKATVNLLPPPPVASAVPVTSTPPIASSSAPSSPVPLPVPSPDTARTAFIATGAALTAVGLGVGLVATLIAQSDMRHAEELGTSARTQYGTSACLSGGPAVCDEISRTIDANQSMRTVATVGFVAAAVLGAGTGAVLTIWPSRNVSIHPGVGSLAMRGKF